MKIWWESHQEALTSPRDEGVQNAKFAPKIELGRKWMKWMTEGGAKVEAPSLTARGPVSL